MNLKDFLSFLSAYFSSPKVTSPRKGIEEYLRNLKKFKIIEIKKKEIISQIIKIKRAVPEEVKSNPSHEVSKEDIEKINELFSNSINLDYPEFEQIASILFKLSKDESKIQFVFDHCNTLLDIYDFSKGLSNLPIYYLEKSTNISKSSFTKFYLKYLKKIPIELYGKYGFFWRPNYLEFDEQNELIRAKYKDINSIPFDFESKAIFEFTFNLLPIWAMNVELTEFYPFLKQISKLPLEYKTKKNQFLYTINPNTKYATYDTAVTNALNYYTYKNPELTKTDLDLINDLMQNMDTYYHHVNTTFYTSILFNLNPDKSFEDFKHHFENVSDPSIAEKYWRNKDYNYKNIFNWFENNGFLTNSELVKKKIETKTVENRNYFLNNKYNVVDLLKFGGNVISYDAEDGHDNVRYTNVFQENYLKQIKEEIGHVELVQTPNDANKLYVIFENRYYQFNVNDYGDYIDTTSLNYLCNYLLELKSSKKKIIPIIAEDQSSVNLFLDLNEAKIIIEKYELEVANG